MNALANDQLYYRVAPIFGRYLKEYGITFGRYTGQVKASAKRDEEEARLWNNPKLMEAMGHPSSIPKNWMLTRGEMLADPPKVLITNYAMLEHLLLLPRNSGLFATNALRCIVLDEIHTYYGAQATEVAFLLRKLKTRLGTTGPIQVFGTSASLSVGSDADEELKKFASDLLDEPISRVIRGKRMTHADLTRPDPGLFTTLAGPYRRAKPAPNTLGAPLPLALAPLTPLPPGLESPLNEYPPLPPTAPVFLLPVLSGFSVLAGSHESFNFVISAAVISLHCPLRRDPNFSGPNSTLFILTTGHCKYSIINCICCGFDSSSVMSNNVKPLALSASITLILTGCIGTVSPGKIKPIHTSFTISSFGIPWTTTSYLFV